jgi:fructosamine-3-kinase
MWLAISQQLSDVLMFSFQISERTKLTGGDINECYMISDGEQRYFVKLNSRDFLQNFLTEADNLRILRATESVLVPEVVHVGYSKAHAFIILNYYPTKVLDQIKPSYTLGQQLAKLHAWGEQKEYGFDQDNYLGSTLQPNPWHKKWPRFFSEQRIGWQLQLLAEKGITLGDIDQIVATISDRLMHHNPKPSLLHGDLWQGNIALGPFGPLCYDPASYWGDRECDIAMTELFGGFVPEFYQGYNSIMPLDSSYQQRKDIYNFYHLLNHCNLFGGRYLTECTQCLTRIKDAK